MPHGPLVDNRVVPTKEGSCFLSGHNRTQISRKKAEILNTELKIRNRELYESIIQIQK
jgi:hypothetical protein